MYKNTYAEKLTDSRWQKKRLEILSRDLFECQMCHSKDHGMLHVHHRHYLVGREPWDYPGDLLVTLCKNCHRKEEDAATNAPEILNTLHFWGYFNTEIIKELNRLIEIKMSEQKSKSYDVNQTNTRLDGQ
jgi:5-methylcytosine-specific restriction endonuclease McrA